MRDDRFLKPKLLLSQTVVEFKATPVIVDGSVAAADALASDGDAAVVAQEASSPSQPSCPPALLEHLALQYLKPFRPTFTSVEVCSTVEPTTAGNMMIQLRKCSALEVCKTVWEVLKQLNLEFAWDCRLHEILESERPLGRKLDPTVVELVVLGVWCRVWSGVAVEPPPTSRKKSSNAAANGARKRPGSKKKREGGRPEAIADIAVEDDFIGSSDGEAAFGYDGELGGGVDGGDDTAWWDESDDGGVEVGTVGEGLFASPASSYACQLRQHANQYPEQCVAAFGPIGYCLKSSF